MDKYSVYSSFHKLETFAKLADAKAYAIRETSAFDDILVIEGPSGETHMARYGRLFRVTATH